MRPFTGALTLGQTFNLAFDNSAIQTGGTVGFGLQTSSGANLFKFYFLGSETKYTINSSGTGGGQTAHNFTTAGMNTSFTLTGTNSYSFSVTFLDNNTTETFSGTMAAGDIDRAPVQFQCRRRNDQFYNDLAVVPEPSTYLAALAGLAILGFRERVRVVSRR